MHDEAAEQIASSGKILHKLTHGEPKGWPDPVAMREAWEDEERKALLEIADYHERIAAEAREHEKQWQGYGRKSPHKVEEYTRHERWAALIRELSEPQQNPSETAPKALRKIIREVYDLRVQFNLPSSVVEPLDIARESLRNAVVSAEFEEQNKDYAAPSRITLANRNNSHAS